MLWMKYLRVIVNVLFFFGIFDLRLVVDDNDNIMWVFGSCLLSGFVGDLELNLFYGFCDNNNLCLVLNSFDIYKVIDGNLFYIVVIINFG